MTSQTTAFLTSYVGIKGITKKQLKASKFSPSDAQIVKVWDLLKEFNKLGKEGFYKKYSELYDLY